MSEGSFDGPRPEPGETERLPVSKGTKQHFSTLLENRARAGIFIPGIDSDSFDFYRSEISGDLNGVPADIRAWWFPKGTNSTQNLRGTVEIERADNIGIVKQFNLKEIPDGLDIEGHERLSKKKLSFEEMIEAIKRDSGEKLKISLAEQDQKLQASKQLERELGIAGVSEKEIQDLIALLDSGREESKPCDTM